MTFGRSFVTIAALLAATAAGAQQQQQQDSTAPSEANDDRDEEITVIGEREGDGPPVINVDSATSTPGASPRQVRGLVKRFFSCSGDLDTDEVRRVLDAKPNTLSARMALDRVIRRGAVCNPTRSALVESPPPYYGECFPAQVGMWTICQSFYYRAGVFDWVMDEYASNLKLSRADTFNPEVAKRFLAVEVPRNDARKTSDRRFFEIAACMVQHQPALAMRLSRSQERPRDLDRFRQLIIDKTPGCTGNAKSVKVDSEELRIYVTEALYRWIVAVRDGQPLVPIKGSS